VYILRMAFLNVGRNRLRSILAILCVFAAAFTNMAMGGLMRGMMNSIVKNYTKNETGHFRISSADFADRERFMPLDENIPDARAVIDALKADPAIAAQALQFAERLSFSVLLSNGDAVRPSLALAGDLEAEKSLLMLQKSIVKGGRYPQKPGEALMGAKMAKALGLDVGSSVKVVTEKGLSGLRMKKFTVSGLVSTGVGNLDDALLFVSLPDAKSLLRMGSEGQQILVMLKDYRKSEAVAARAGRVLAAAGLGEGLAVKPWTAIGEYYAMVAMMEKAFLVIYVALSFLGAFIITNIMMMVVLERTREIGLLKSMGFTPRQTLLLFCAEGAILGALGSLAGTAFGWAFNAAVRAAKGYDFSSLMSSLSFPMESSIMPANDPAMVFTVLGIGILVSAIVSLSPARFAARLNPIDAIKAVQ
jgi:putative ABC transport system permease protein